MSATSLREKTRAEILKVIEGEASALIHTDDDALSVCRRQGFLRGLQKSIDILNNNYKDLNG